ncbi:unnamed protein product, partial [Cladocopium goreaui]
LHFYWHRPPLELVEQQSRDPDTVRILLNGCFDLMHVGHFNALRQAKRLFFQQGYKKVVMVAGIHSDEAISNQKGPPMMSNDERTAILEATKWVDEFVTQLPYTQISVQMADTLRVKWVCHGDDMPVCRGGHGMYSAVVEEKRFQVLKRTEGISTTQIISRIIQQQGWSQHQGEAGGAGEALSSALCTAQRLQQFAAPPGDRPPKQLTAAKRVVYVPGIFDLIHPGHVSILRQAATLGDFLLVGLYSDETVTVHRNHGKPPVLTLLERALAVLSMRWVDDVVLGAPWNVTDELLTSMNISCVVLGRAPGASQEDSDQFLVPRRRDILTELTSCFAISSEALKQRLIACSAELVKRNSKMMEKELSYISGKGYVPEA